METVEATPTAAVGDPERVAQITRMLVENALVHTEPGTPVRIRTLGENGVTALQVEDEGPGVPGDLRQAIFEPFRQGRQRTPHSPGVGIGLSLVARFAELHGGRSWVEDRPGGGASFRVFLPFVAPDGASPLPSETDAGRLGGGFRADGDRPRSGDA